MKLKYYLRGLAIGVILTTVILTIANADNKPLTDAQIRQRALELGMIEGSSLKLTDVQEESTANTLDTESKTPESIATESKDSESKTPETKAPESKESESKESESAQTKESVDASAQVSTAQTSSDTETVEQTQEPAVVTITIKGGDSSYTVSKAMAAAGIVEDAVDFDNYLCNYGYSRSIRTGTYEIKAGMSYEEIAKLIAG